MSLLQWSTPARETAERVLPIIPNEIYFCIFEHLAPPTGRLTPEQLGIFTNLSRVCRFFANFCLPRIFEFVEFPGSDDTSTRPRNDAIYETSRESTLCTQIAAKQPLALALAKAVKVCHFYRWKHNGRGLWEIRPFVDEYIAGFLHMKNIRELEFTNSFLQAEEWNAIATLETLEELSFDYCRFLRDPEDVEPEKWVRVKVSRLGVVNCDSVLLHQLIATIDARYLRTLVVDDSFFKYVDWLSHSALTELHVAIGRRFYVALDYMQRLRAILMQAHQSLEVLVLFVENSRGLKRIVRTLFNDPMWKNFPLLRSLILCVTFLYGDKTTVILSSALEGVCLLTNLQSFTLKDERITPVISPAEVRRMLHDKLSPASSLRHVDIYGMVLHLVDGEWSGAPSSMA